MRTLDTLQLDLGDNSYPIYISAGALSDADLLQPHIVGRRVMIVTNTTVAPLFLPPLKASLADYNVDIVELADGEEHKTLAAFDQIISALLEKQHNRSTTVIALGGGVVGDTAGFAAACYQRGVAFIQVPTTLLAQVDSSVGGKTAVNHRLGKNMVGAFHQPRAVIIDPQTLTTLPQRELSAGLAEVIKHGMLADADYFAWLEREMRQLLALNPDKMAYAIKRSCEIKASVVARDEKELGARALLNLGHTFGHAIETGMGHGAWLHGEAVGVGLVMAAALSHRLGTCTREQSARVSELVSRAGLPVTAPACLKPDFLALMGRDKKATDAGLRLVLLQQLGQAELVDNVSKETLQQVIDDFLVA